MQRRSAWHIWIAITITSSSARAETWIAGAALGDVTTIAHDSTAPCAVTWYSPGPFAFPGGDLGLLAQGKNRFALPSGAALKDSIYTARRSAATGAWTVPDNAAPPTLTGLYMTGGSPQNCGYSQTAPGPVASPKVVYLPPSVSNTPTGRYYMAFIGGNGDFIRGQVYWATSVDATTWTILKWQPLPTGFTWRPLVGPIYGVPGYPGDPTCAPYGITQLMLTYDPSPALGPNGGFYLHLPYVHTDGGYDMIALRFPYTTANAFGLDGTSQIYTCGPSCGWVAHSGQLRWTYDPPPAPGDPDPVLVRNAGTPMAQGPGDIVQIPGARPWLHVGSFNNTIFSQTATSLAAQDWSTPTPINRAALDASIAGRYPGYANDAFDPGLWYGTLGARTGVWGLFPVRYQANTCAIAYRGLAIATAPLDTSP